MLNGRYLFDAYSLEYFKIYTSILKEKCKTLFEIIEDLFKISKGTITEEGLNWMRDLDISVNDEGTVSYEDAGRIVNVVVYNVRDLYEKNRQGNNLETYLTFKESRHRLDKDGMFECEIYPRKEIQIKNLDYDCCRGLLDLSERQKEELMEERLENISRMIEEDFLEDELEDVNVLIKKSTNS